MEKETKDVFVIIRATRADRAAWTEAAKSRGGVSKVVRKHLDRLVASKKKKETS